MAKIDIRRCYRPISGYVLTADYNVLEKKMTVLITSARRVMFYGFTRRLSVCLSVCLFVCEHLYVKTTDLTLHENFIRNVSLDKEEH